MLHMFNRHRCSFDSLFSVPIWGSKRHLQSAQHRCLCLEPPVIRSLLCHQHHALHVVSPHMEHHDSASYRKPLFRHVPYGRCHIDRCWIYCVAWPIWIWRTSIPLHALGVVVGRLCNIHSMLLGCHLYHVRLPPPRHHISPHHSA
jgi:hypothetical protein